MISGRPLIQLEKVSKAFPGTRVFKTVDLEVGPGELVVVLGSNGAGKTTLLRMMAGLLGLDAGKILIEDETLERFSEKNRTKISFWPDFPPFFENLSVLENVEVWINLYRKSDEDREKEALSALENFDLMKLVRLSPASLSRGQRYKLAMTCYAAVQAKIGLFDEPFASGMDARGLASMKRIMKEAVVEGRTVIYTTQLVKYALDFANRVLVIEDGGIYFDGSVEAFLESMNGGDEVLGKFRETEE